MQLDFDVLVVGGSVAGSTLALQLGRSGIRVAFIDKETSAHRKACGEGLSSLALRELDALGILPGVLALPHAAYRGYRIWYGERSALLPASVFGAPEYPSIGIERAHLDNFLRTQALSYRSVTPFFGTRVTEIGRDLDSPVIELDGRRLRGRFLVLADGARSPLAEQLGIHAERARKPRFGTSFHLTGTFSDTYDEVNVVCAENHEIFVTRVGERRVNVSVLADQKKIQSADLKRISRSIPELLRDRFGFSVETIEESTGASALASTRRAPVSGRTVLVGDACETLDPIGGMGITHAILSASSAARSLTDALFGECAEDVSLRRYAAEHRAITRPLRGFTRTTYFVLKELQTSAALSLLRSPLVASSGGERSGSSRNLPRRVFDAIGYF